MAERNYLGGVTDDEVTDAGGEEEEPEGSEATETDKDEYIARLKAEAKKHRLKAKENARKLREYETQDRPTEDRLRDVVGERDRLREENEVLRAAAKHGISDTDYFGYKLRRSNVLRYDEDGDLENAEAFDEAAAKLAKEMSGEKPGKKGETPPRSPSLSGKKAGKETDFQALSKRYPALLHRSGPTS